MCVYAVKEINIKLSEAVDVKVKVKNAAATDSCVISDYVLTYDTYLGTPGNHLGTDSTLFFRDIYDRQFIITTD